MLELEGVALFAVLSALFSTGISEGVDDEVVMWNCAPAEWIVGGPSIMGAQAP
jgi:hypothetical protein